MIIVRRRSAGETQVEIVEKELVPLTPELLFAKDGNNNKAVASQYHPPQPQHSKHETNHHFHQQNHQVHQPSQGRK